MGKLFKSFILLAGISLLLAGCAKEEQEQIALQGDSVTFNVSAENGTSTKAVQDQDGAADCINHWVMEVRDSDGDVYARKDEDGTVGEKNHSFNVKLVKDHTYTVLFWADTKDTYNTADLTNVKLSDGDTTGYAANKDSRDAFSAVVLDFKCTGTSSQDVTLKRPFGQLNIIFTDLKALYDDMGSETEYQKFSPCSLKVTAKVPTSFNVETQTAGNPATTALNVTADSAYKDNYATHRAEETIFMDYFFATKDSKDVVDLGFSFVSRGETTTHTFTSVPFQRNYRTNIKGELMTAGATWNVEVVPTWDGEIDRKIASVSSIAAANDSLEAGATNIVIKSPSDVADTIVFPAASANQTISFIISGATDSTITFKNAEGTEGPSNLVITSDSKNLDINCPNTHVEVLTGTYAAVTATTSSTTLVVNKDVTIDTLTISGGNAEIHGIVNVITKAAGSTVTYRIETLDALKKLRDLVNAGTWTNGKVYLDVDIDLNNEEWEPIKAYKGGQGVNYSIDLDGQNHTISNLKITGSSDFSYIGFFSEATDLTVKDLTFDGADLEWPKSVGENARGGVLVGNVWGINAENVAVKDVTIKACQKIGALIGYIEGDTNVPNTVKNCSAENVSISSNQPDTILEHGSGGFIGHITQYQNPVTTISGCSVKNITIADYNQNPYSAEQLQKIPHVFVGSVVQNYTGDETPSISSHSIVFDNNTISGENTDLPTCIYSSKYFGWAGNAEERPDWKGYVYVDGDKWVPDYSFECGGVKYCTLSQAVTAAKAGSDKTVTILKTGDYTLPGDVAGITIQAGTDVVPTFTITSKGSIASADESTLKGLKFILPGDTYTGFYHSDATFDGCTFENLLTTYCGDQNQVFKNCSFKSSGNNYGVWAYGPCEFNTCTFTTDEGKAIYLYAESQKAGYVVDFDSCTFTNTGASCRKPAIIVKTRVSSTLYTNGYKTTVTNCTADGFANFASKGDDVYDYAADGLWGIETKAGDDLTYTATYLTVDGTQVYPAYYPDANNAALHHIISAKGFKAFRYEINDQKINYAGHTVQLDVDIDLENETWTPVECENNKFGTFDGKGHKISNFTVNVDGSNGIKHAGLFGEIGCGTVKDLSIYNANVTGINHVGAIAGDGMCGKFENCKVYNSNVTSVVTNGDDGDKAGAICGYLTAEPSASMTGCYAEGCTITAYRDLGSLVGYANGSAVVTGNTATGCTIICKTDNNYNGYTKKADFDANEIVGEAVAAATVSDNTATDITITYSPDIAE